MTCLLGATGRRVLKARHEPTCDAERPGTLVRCPGCLPCPERHCLTCERLHVERAAAGSPLLTCPACLAVARMNLAAIVTLAARLGLEARHGRAATKVHGGLPGGDALVLLAPGAERAGTLGQLAHRLDFELDTTHVRDELASDPRPPLQVLTTWETSERRRTGTGRHPGAPERRLSLAEQQSLPTVARYLRERLPLMAREPIFVAFSRDLATCVRQLENVLHDGERPETTRVPCWECGTRLVKVYAAAAYTERADFWECPHCREKYDAGRFARAKVDHLASEGAERFVLVADGAQVIGRPERTVRTWIARGQVRFEKHPVTKRLMVWWPDIRDRHTGGDECV